MAAKSVVDTGLIEAAPNDGAAYGQVNGSWQEVMKAVAGEVQVDDLTDLPAAVGGVITLAADTAYKFTTGLDFLGARIVLSSGTVLLGTSSETAILKSTGLAAATPFISAAHGGPNPMQNFRIEDIGTVFDIDGQSGANAALDWVAVNLVNCGNAGTIRDITNLIVNTSAWLDCGQLTLDGTIGTVGFFQMLWTVPSGSGKTAIRFEPTCVISRRFRYTYGPMVVPAGCVGIDVVDRVSTFLDGETMGLLFANFSGGGTYLQGATYDDVETIIEATRGLTNSAPSAHFYLTNNATPTPIAVSGTFYKVEGATSEGTYSAKFVFTANRATYAGGFARFFRIAASVALTSGNNNNVRMRVAVNGTTLADTNQRAVTGSGGRLESMTTLGTVLLNPGDFVEVWVANDSGTTDITVTDMQVTVSAIA